MKKVLLTIVMCLSFGINTNAEDDYPDDDPVTVIPIDNNDNPKESLGYYGLGFYSYDGAENYSLSYGMYKFNGLGIGMNLRSNFKFSDNQNTFNADVLLNYSFGVYSNTDVAVLITPEIGPSLGSRYIFEMEKDKPKAKEKYYIDGFVGIKMTLAFGPITLSAGYHIWAPKWKFGKNEKADGFYAQLGIEI